MKKIASFIICVVIMVCLLPEGTYAREGDAGYEGGISSGESPSNTTREYQEVCFLSGEPIVLKGTLIITKQMKQDKITSTYKYSLKNTDKAASLTRVLSFTTILTTKENNQVVEETSYTKAPTETIKIGSQSYILKSNDFTRSSLVDTKPAINYYAGNVWSKKVYQVGTTASGGSVTIETTGDFYGYDQYWGNVEVEVLNQTISSEKNNGGKVDKWGGTARVSLSSSITKQVKYYKNQPDEISFDGSYLLTQNNNNILEYSSSLPVFDSKGISTDKVVEKSDSLKIETFPVQKRLPAVNLSYLKGHWAENNIKLLYGLEVFTGNGRNFKPEQNITRGEFASAIVGAAKEVPPDPALVSKTTTSKSNKKQTVISPFDDVSIDNIYFNQINSAYTRGLIEGKGKNLFGPNDSLTMADAINIFIRAVGLESLAPSPTPVTSFKDNDKIPASARTAAYVAQKIGLIVGDSKGNLNPNAKLTKAQTAAMLNRFITYMQDGIKKEYRDRIVNY